MSSGPRSILVVDPPGQDAHDAPPGHPERFERVEAVRRGVVGVVGADVVNGRDARDDELTRVHDPALVARVKEMCERAPGWIDDETFVSSGSFQAARRAAGAGLTAIERLSRPDPPNAAFVLVRPPGHHAGVATSRGFCIFNNIAVAALHLIDTGANVAVIDWDAHHGDGTQEILWAEPRALFVSIHQESHYPGTGLPHERGPSPDRLTTLNLPLPAGATGDRYLALLDTIVEPAMVRFEPDWLLVSCGFDAHADDPLADMALTADDFGLLAARAAKLAPSAGRVVLFLEGGYDLTALEESTAAVLGTLSEPDRELRASAGGPGALRVEELRRFLVPV